MDPDGFYGPQWFSPYLIVGCPICPWDKPGGREVEKVYVLEILQVFRSLCQLFL